MAVPRSPVAWRASSPPGAAAARAEREAPAVGLGWGRLRGWEREGEGWRLVWQPAHGAWLVRAWVSDGPAPIAWRLDAAPWLPGVRLSEQAARALAGGTSDGVAREQGGRRDWVFDDVRLLGTLPAGGRLPASERTPRSPWLVLFGGCLVAGALSRAVFPGAVSPAWRRVTVLAAALVVPVLPLATALGARSFRVGVRPWIAELVVGSAALVLLGALAAAAVRFPASRGTPRGLAVLLAAAAGLLAGRLQPVPHLADVAGLNVRAVLWAALIVLCGWLAALGGEGLRELLRPIGPLRSAVLLGVGVAAAADRRYRGWRRSSASWRRPPEIAATGPGSALRSPGGGSSAARWRAARGLRRCARLPSSSSRAPLQSPCSSSATHAADGS